jgi:putative ABC transport system permease protein
LTLEETLLHAGRAVVAHRLRSLLTMLGTTIGVGSVILLTSVGEGVRHYLISEFTQFGTNLMAINPGSFETSGIAGAVGVTVNPLTLEDVEAIDRLRGVSEIVPVAMGTASVEHESRSRDVFVYGVSHAVPRAWQMGVRAGRFLPAGDLRAGAPRGGARADACPRTLRPRQCPRRACPDRRPTLPGHRRAREQG